MKIGIMSMQRITNYGSFLQAYALKNLIESLGHKVCFVDYKIGEPVEKDDSLIKNVYVGNTKLILRLAAKKLLGKEIYFVERYKKMLFKLGVTEKMHYNTPVDTLVIGSDEVFNCLQANPDVGFSPELFGKNANAKKLISYGASFGTTTVERLHKYGKYDEIKGYLEKFDMLSARDENTAQVLSDMGINNYEMNLDPVLMYDFTKDVKENKDIKDYILVYSYAGRIKDDKEISAIVDFARKNGKKIVTVGYHQSFSDVKLDADAFELLGYIKNADYVVTDTFHGTIFSTIMRKQFVTIIRDSNKEKLGYLLEKLGLECRRLKNPQELETLINSKIDYEKTGAIINEERKRTIEYLKRNL